MGRTCSICYAWAPKEWASKGWADTVAFCKIKGKFTMHDATCEDCALVAPKVNPPRTVAVREKPSYTEVPRSPNIEDRPTPVITGELYAHQREAIEKYKDETEIPLFMEMGTGKSATILRIAGHKFKTGQINALLIVAPNDVHVQWFKEQIPLWLDCAYDVQCLFGRGGQRESYPFRNEPEYLQVVCVNIDTFSTPSKWKDIVDWALARKTFIVLDEATTIKSVTSQRTQRMLYSFNEVIRHKKTIKSSRVLTSARAILTGTPVTNGPMDLWAIMEFLRPNFFGRNWYSFRFHYGMFTNVKFDEDSKAVAIPINEERWDVIKRSPSYQYAFSITGCSEDTYNVIQSQDHYSGPYKHAEELKAKLDEIAYFKRLTDCVDMPPQMRITRTLEMTPEIFECYTSMVTELIAMYDNHVMSAKSKLTAIIRLQQITSGFIYDKSFDIDTEEIDPVLLEKAIQCLKDGRTSILGTLLPPEMLTMIEPGLKAQGEEIMLHDLEQMLADSYAAAGKRTADKLDELYGLCGDEVDIEPDAVQWIGKSNPKLEALYRDVDEAAHPYIIITRFTAEASRIYDDLCRKYRVCLVTGWKRVGTIEEFKDGKYDIMVANIAAVARGFNLQIAHGMSFYSNTFSLEARLQAEGRIFRIGQTNPCSYIDYVYSWSGGASIDEKVVAALSMKRNLLEYIRGADIRDLVC